MTIKRAPSRAGPEGVKSGFTHQDEYQLRKWNNPLSNPRIQIWTEEDLDDEPEEVKRYYCAMCKSRLEHLPKLEYWQCSSCSEVYDNKYLHDTPLKSITDHKLMPHTALQYYPQYDDDDPNIPFVSAVDIDDNLEEEDNPDFQVTKSSSDNRVKFIKVRGSPADALAMTKQHEERIRK